MIISDSRHPLDRDPLVSWSRRERVTPVGTFDAVFDEARLGAARVIVTDLDEWPPGAAHQIARALTNGAEAAAILLRTDLSRRALMEIPLLAASPALQRAHVLAGAARGASAQACAEWAGFDDVSALDKYLKYHFSRDFAELCNEHGLDAQVDRIVAWLERS